MTATAPDQALLARFADYERRIALLELNVARSGGVVIGEIKAFGGSTVPANFLGCVGGTQLIADYPALAAVLGTTWGGNGTTTFGIPDLRGRTMIGSGTGSGLTARTLGQQSIGEETHLLTASESGTTAHSHGHTLGTGNDNTDHAHSGTTNTEGSHRHGQYVTGGTPGGGSLRYDYNGDGNYSSYEQGVWTGAGEAHAHGFSTGGRSAFHQHSVTGGISNSTAANASSAHNNMQPSAVVTFIIRAKP